MNFGTSKKKDKKRGTEISLKEPETEKTTKISWESQAGPIKKEDIRQREDLLILTSPPPSEKKKGGKIKKSLVLGW